MLRLEVVTPEKVALQKEVDSVVLPAYEGEMGILTGHAPILAQLVPGELRYSASGETSHLAVSGGFAEVLANKVSVFAETAEMMEEIDMERARQAAERAKAILSQARTAQQEVDIARAQAALRRALVRLRGAEEMRRRAGGKA